MKKIIGIILAFSLIMPVGASADELPCYYNDEEKHIYASSESSGKRIALTFDDGPHPVYTDRILSILEKYGAKATFFVIGKNIEYYPDVLERVKNAGHTIGSHTYTHGHIKNQSEECLREELQKNAEILSSHGVTARFFRPPEGVCDEKVVKTAREFHSEIILWAIDTGDWACPGKKAIENAVIGKVKGGEIVLMHDYVSGKSTTPEALEQILEQLTKEGYSFVSVDELIDSHGA